MYPGAADPIERALIDPACPPKVAQAAMERAYDRGLVDYGVSLRSGWLTKAGLHLLDTTPPTIPASITRLKRVCTAPR